MGDAAVQGPAGFVPPKEPSSVKFCCGAGCGLGSVLLRFTSPWGGLGKGTEPKVWKRGIVSPLHGTGPRFQSVPITSLSDACPFRVIVVCSVSACHAVRLQCRPVQRPLACGHSRLDCGEAAERSPARVLALRGPGPRISHFRRESVPAVCERPETGGWVRRE